MTGVAADALGDQEDAAWRGFLLTHDRVWRELESRLAPLSVSMAEYSVLALLGEAGPQGMRMSDLASRRLMSTGGFTRLADRLERRGLIERRRSESDGRSLDAVLTSAGRTLLRRAWRQHRHDVRELFLDRLTEGELRTLVDIWVRLDPGDGGGATEAVPAPR